LVFDNLQALVAATAASDTDLPQSKRCNYAYAHTALKPLLRTLLLGAKIGRKVARLLMNFLDLIAGGPISTVKIFRQRESRNKSCTSTSVRKLLKWLNLVDWIHVGGLQSR
jgi:hypothetical protein